jgi:hypothetical protein
VSRPKFIQAIRVVTHLLKSFEMHRMMLAHSNALEKKKDISQKFVTGF